MKLPVKNAALLLACTLLHTFAWSQSVPNKLTAAFKKFEEDPQLRNSISSLYVAEAGTGKVIFDKNGMIGLAPASTMKIITSISAYELLGKNFRYETKFGYRKEEKEGRASLFILPSGDPTFGSWRWPDTKEAVVLSKLTQAIRNTGFRFFDGVYVSNEGWNEETIPDGWMWQDIGNYYGAGPGKLNWRENQYDVILQSGQNIGDPVRVVKTVPRMNGFVFNSELTSAAAGTGDNAFIYFPVSTTGAPIRGTIPVNENNFKISGAMPSPGFQFISTLSDTLKTIGIHLPRISEFYNKKVPLDQHTFFYTVTSPPLDSIVYWFNRRSINLYGEALLKTIAYQKQGSSSSDKGLEVVRDYWQKQGIPVTELSMVDGSGLSPLNRVTTHAQVQLLQYARKKDWYDSFYTSLPLYNGIKMKSGTIRGVKGYCGYHKSKDGKEYVFSFLVNNYNGSASALVQKMYKVLDELK